MPEAAGDGIRVDWNAYGERTPPPPRRRRVAEALIAVGLASAGGYLALAVAGNLRERLALFLAVWVALAVLYVLALALFRRCEPDRASLAILIGGAALFRLVMLPAAPGLSDDVHRYVRDGWVQVNGVNPYRHAPDDPALAGLRLPDHHRINNPSIPTIYPPLAQAVFAAAAFVRPSPYVLKVILLLFDAGIVLVLILWLRSAGRSPLGAAVYAWHPLTVVEGAGSAHVDVMGAFFLVLAVWLIIGDRKFASSAALAAAVLSKLLPLLLLPFFVRSWKVRHMAVAAAVVLVVAAPYAAGAGENLFAGLGQYAARWEFNGSITPLLEAALDRLEPTEALKSALTSVKTALRDPAFLEPVYGWLYPPHLARALAAALAILAICWIAVGSMPPDREVLAGLAVLMLLTPTLHPWYLLWMLPFLAVWRSPSWLWLTLAVGLSYIALGRPDGRVPLWVQMVEYLPMAVMAVTGAWIARRRERRRRDRAAGGV